MKILKLQISFEEKTLVDIEQWNRKEHFQFFKEFEEPFYGVTTEVDVTKAYKKCKENKISFFIYYLYQTIKAVNETKNFRLRIESDKVYLYESIHASATIGREDETFGFSYIKFDENFETFYKIAQSEIKRVQNIKGLGIGVAGNNVIHFSSLPWFKFSSLSHARSFSFEDSAPKISFDKLTKSENKFTMNVSIHVHHALVDGIHIGKFVASLQSNLNN